MADLLANVKAFYERTARDLEGAGRFFTFATAWGSEFFPYDMNLIASINPLLLAAIQTDDPAWEPGGSTEAASDAAVKAFYGSLALPAPGGLPLLDAMVAASVSQPTLLSVIGMDQDGTHYDGYIDMLRAAILADDPEWEV